MPTAVIAKKEKYTMGVIVEKPKNISVITIAKSGIRKAQCFLLKNVPAKSATAVMGATFGGCGRNRTRTATTTKLIRTVSFLLNAIVLSSYTKVHFFRFFILLFY
jgi:hypothetical protein